MEIHIEVNEKSIHGMVGDIEVIKIGRIYDTWMVLNILTIPTNLQDAITYTKCIARALECAK